MKILKFYVAIWLWFAISGFSMTAQATVVSVDLDGDDCSGAFTAPGERGFESCLMWLETGDDVRNFAPMLARLDAAGIIDTNPQFPTLDGSEFAINVSRFEGDWVYAGHSDDPVVLYWTAKGRHGFNLFFDIDDADFIANGGDCDPARLLSSQCLGAANAVSAGDYVTPFNIHGRPHLLHHLTLYGEYITVVPVPAALWLFASGLVVLLGVARRR
jgi:hypothetical protein